MKVIPADAVCLAANRQRREFDPASLMELTESIGRNGLLQPLVVRYDAENDIVVLVAGERRLRAIKDLWGMGGQLRCNAEFIDEGLIPVLTLGELDEVAAFEAELEENIRRVDLTWQEQATAIKQLHDLRTLQSEKRGEIRTIQQTAEELYDRSDGDYAAKTKRQIVVAAHLDDPDIAKASSAKEAFKILEQKENLREHAKRAAIFGESFGAHSHRLFLGDAIHWMAELEAGSFDCVLADPPYGIGADSFGDGAGKLTGITHDYKDDVGSFQTLMMRALEGINRVAKPEAHLYICCDIDQFHFLRGLFTNGWNVFRTPLINHKVGSGRVPLPEHGPRRTYETILYAYRGGRKVTAIYDDVLDSRGDDNYGHGAQKPVNLYTQLLQRSCRAGDSALDPFCGTGTIFPACHELSVRATGIELEPAYYGIAVRRLEELK